MWLTIRAAYIFYFFALWKGIDHAQSFLGYVLSTNSSFAFDFLQHHVHICHKRNYDKQKAVVVVEASLILGFRVANLAFLKPYFEILAFFEHLWLFLEIKKSQTKSDFFWLFFSRKGLDLETHCLSCISIKNLF